MLDKVLGGKLLISAQKLDEEDKICEIRIRSGCPVIVETFSGKYYLGENGKCSGAEAALTAGDDMIESVMLRATKYSLYSVEDELKHGYITLSSGIRIGIAGRAVLSGGKVSTMKDIVSLNIRIPHSIEGVSEKAFRYIYTGQVKNTLIVSPPGAGKTTYLKDIAARIAQENVFLNLLILDERGEFAHLKGTIPSLDILSSASKKFGFSAGIRALSPNVILCDELGGEEDEDAVSYALKSGVKVIATLHGEGREDVAYRKKLSELFERFVLLSKNPCTGTLKEVFDASGRALYQSE